jgi:hypothetical protein
VSVNIVAEINIVNFVCVTLIHVALNDQRKDAFRSKDSELGKHSEVLVLANMSTVSDVKVLEHRLQVNATVLHSSSVLLNEGLDQLFFLL